VTIMSKTIPYKHHQQVMHLGVAIRKKQLWLFIQILFGMLDGDGVTHIMVTDGDTHIMDGDIPVTDGVIQVMAGVDTQAVAIQVMDTDTLTQRLMPIITVEEVLMEEIMLAATELLLIIITGFLLMLETMFLIETAFTAEIALQIVPILLLTRTETMLAQLEITLKINQEVLTHKIEPALTAQAITNDQAQTTHLATAAHTEAAVAVAICPLAVALECPAAEAEAAEAE